LLVKVRKNLPKQLEQSITNGNKKLKVILQFYEMADLKALTINLALNPSFCQIAVCSLVF
jgi:hypothetical protein